MNMNSSIPAKTVEASGTAARILVVDDVADNRDILTRRLTRRGYQVLEACNGTEALEVLAREPIDLVLLDIMMPDIDGTEVVREIRKTRSPSDLPIIMVSAKTQSEDVSHSLDLGANDYVIKPVDFTVALARIRAQLERKRAADEMARKTAADREELRRKSELLKAASTSRQQSQDRLTYLAFHDELTGLANRVGFRETLDLAVSGTDGQARELALLFIDLDRFKAINDVYGHCTGDTLLKLVGKRLAETLDGATAVARLGGDEFAAIIAEDRLGISAVELAERVCDALSEPFHLDLPAPFRIGASVGVAYARVCEYKPAALMKAADLAMYCAKSGGRGRVVVFEPHLLKEQRERSLLEVELRRAIELGQFELYYQPVLDSRTRELRSLEALLRWNHPQRGVILPGIFIPAAEEIGLINALGAWILRRACADAVTWSTPARVAVNLSPVQFRHPELIATIVDALDASRLEPQRLEVEITEACLLDAGDQSVAILGAIRELGVRVVIDGFGTGYSSMSYLQNFAFDKLKIDRCLVGELQVNSKTSAVIKALVQLGTTIGISTTAEGIETEAQLETALSHGCAELQGFLLSSPMPAGEADAFIRAQAAGSAPRPAPSSS